MPDVPRVEIEEGGARPPPITGVGTNVTAFLGEADCGPASPTTVRSLSEFRDTFGAGAGHLAASVAGFFDNGGRTAVIVRTAPALGAYEAGLAALETEAVSLVYAPDALATPGLAEALIAHCERLRDRMAVIDAPVDGDPLAPRAGWETRYGAYYHPWLRVADPAGGTRLVPPGGHVLGVYARTDTERGVHKAPANEVVKGAVGLARDLTDADQEVLNPAGVNLIRSFPGRGIRVWGARTLSSDPEWKYVNVRRLFTFLERSIDEGTRWAVFEPNGERLWVLFREAVTQFLYGQWRAGVLQGRTPREAFFVQCDRTTMTQDDLDNGRLVCVIGVAPVKPAEFVIVRIGQWTADRDPPP